MANYKIEDARKEKDLKLLQELADFAKGPIVDKVLSEWISGNKFTPIDS